MHNPDAEHVAYFNYFKLNKPENAHEILLEQGFVLGE